MKPIMMSTALDYMKDEAKKDLIDEAKTAIAFLAEDSRFVRKLIRRYPGLSANDIRYELELAAKEIYKKLEKISS